MLLVGKGMEFKSNEQRNQMNIVACIFWLITMNRRVYKAEIKVSEDRAKLESSAQFQDFK